VRAALLAVLSLLLLPALASAGTVVSVRGASGPGPARYDRVSYERFGPASAKRVLILVPGTQGGAGDFSLVAPEIVKRVRGLQVWAYDRRSQAFEDHRNRDIWQMAQVLAQPVLGSVAQQELGSLRGAPHLARRSLRRAVPHGGGFPLQRAASGRLARSPREPPGPGEGSPHARRPALLHHVGQLVPDHPLAFGARRLVLPRREVQVLSVRVGHGADRLGGLAPMYPHAEEALAERAFHLRAQRLGQGLSASPF